MSNKDRPFKSYRSPLDRPFKTYKPGGSVLFQESDDFRIPMSMAGKMQHQPNQPPSAQQTALPSLPQQQMQVYGDPNDFTRLPPGINQGGIQGGMMPLESSLNQYYNDLGLGETDNNMVRPEMLVPNDSILHQQREQDFNIPSSVGQHVPGSMSMFGRNLMRGVPQPNLGNMSSMSESFSMLFDQPTPSPLAPSPLASSLHLHNQQKANDGLGTNSHSHHNLNNSQDADQTSYQPSSNINHLASAGLATSTTNPGNSCDALSPTSNGSNSFVHPVIKQEIEDNSQSCGIPASSPSPTSTHSPSTTSETGSESIDSRRGMKRPALNSPTGPVQDKPDGNGTGPGPSSSINCDIGSAKSPSHITISPDTKSEKERQLDPAYLEKRRKNNESAKRSREARRTKEEMVALRVVTLEEENMRLRAESSLLEKELDELRHRLFN